jgi:hypothetical protein
MERHLSQGARQADAGCPQAARYETPPAPTADHPIARPDRPRPASQYPTTNGRRRGLLHSGPAAEIVWVVGRRRNHQSGSAWLGSTLGVDVDLGARPMNDEQSGAAERITHVVASWPEVDIGPHRFGGVEFRLGRRELGHLHGNRIADLPFSAAGAR